MSTIYLIHRGCIYEGGRTIHVSSTPEKAIAKVDKILKGELEIHAEFKDEDWWEPVEPWVRKSEFVWEGNGYEQIVVVPTPVDED